MIDTLKLTAVGVIAGTVLLLILWVVNLLTGNTAYYLLTNFDYVPIIKHWRPVWFFGMLFHYVTCMVSIIALYYILKPFKLQKEVWWYVIVYSLGGGALFFLTALSPQLPEYTDIWAWVFWTLGHAIFGFSVGALIKKWM